MCADDGGLLAAALPLGESDRLGPDLVKAQGLELRLGPGHRAWIRFTAGNARAHFGGQRFHHCKAGAVGQRLLAQLRGGAQRAIGNAGGRGKRCGGGKQGGDGDSEATHAGRLQRQGGLRAYQREVPVCVRKVILVCEVRARMWPLVYGTVGFLSVSFLSESRISRSSSTSSLGPLGASGLRWLRRLISLTTRKIAKAMITNCTTVLMKSP